MIFIQLHFNIINFNIGILVHCLCVLTKFFVFFGPITKRLQHILSADFNFHLNFQWTIQHSNPLLLNIHWSMIFYIICMIRIIYIMIIITKRALCTWSSTAHIWKWIFLRRVFIFINKKNLNKISYKKNPQNPTVKWVYD